MIQAIIGNIGAGSLFALLQSIGMGGAIPTAIFALAAGLGARVGALLGMGAAGGGQNDEGLNGEAPAG